jgi:hypothetical protein
MHVTKVLGYKANRIFMIMVGIQLVLLIAALLYFPCLTDPLVHCVIIGAALCWEETLNSANTMFTHIEVHLLNLLCFLWRKPFK